MESRVYITSHGFEYEGTKIDGVFSSIDEAMIHISHMVHHCIISAYKSMDEYDKKPNINLLDFYTIVTADVSNPTNVDHLMTLFLDEIEEEFYNRLYIEGAKRLTFEDIKDKLYQQKDKQNV
jgi:hypothetical protein